MLRSILLCLLLPVLLCGCRPATPTPTPSTPPKRVVSLIPSVTEMIFAVGAGDRVVGVTLNDDYPPEVEDLPKVGDQTVDLEKVATLKPDLVILDSAFNRDKEGLQRLGLRVEEIHCERLSDVPRAMRELGKVLGREKQAEEEAARFESSLSAIDKVSFDGTVFVEVWGDPLMTVGSGNLIDDVLATLGLENSYSDIPGDKAFQVDPEDLVSRGPSVILRADGQTGESRALTLLRKTGKEPRLVTIDPDILVRPGPRLIKGLEALSEEFGQVK